MTEPRGPGRPVRVKICGVTRAEDARRAADLGADFLGLNFYLGSPRFLAVEPAREIAEAVRGRVGLVGVFVNESRRRIEEIAAQVGLDLLQFHGDEGGAELEPFGGRAIKVLRCTGRPAAADLAGFPGAWGFLLERRDARLYGGTGEEWDFRLAADPPTRKPVLLGGGLGPGNVCRAVHAARPWGIDVCSRIESAPGVKDPRLLELLFRAVREAREAEDANNANNANDADDAQAPATR